MSLRTMHLVATAVAVGALATTSGSAAAAGFEKPEASCQPRSILALPPVMYPTGQGQSSGSTSTLYGSEQIAFRANLAQLVNGRWTTIRTGTWKWKSVALGGDVSVSFSENWFFDLTTRTWGSGSTAFAITQPGTYAVFYNLFWYATGEHASTWAAHLDVRTTQYDTRLYSTCRY